MKNEAKEPTEDGFYYVKNKFGVVQHIADQCEERSCTCISGCRLDDLIIQEHWLLDTYVRTMKKSSRKDSGC